MNKADAYPRKRFFLEMFTRDISLEDCLLDLVDNAVDSFIRGSDQDIIGSLLDVPTAAATLLREITLVVTSKEVSVTDNCGGIPNDEALHDVFCFGHAKGYEPEGRLGVLRDRSEESHLQDW